ncbi:Hypothetical protein I596_1302 [Dokdonella koreensis DS-123]|uniref:Uncharacterized protein n=1 Tax=Dokdonella koreensis DS-123 TaxID=1300342 RepID=A0A167GRW9_9GAMM|nr:Hypothetical protein I596_1302 [Dokdonella koreensis DS-123]
MGGHRLGGRLRRPRRGDGLRGRRQEQDRGSHQEALRHRAMVASEVRGATLPCARAVA